MDYFSDEILNIPSIAPDLLFADEEEEGEGEVTAPCSPEIQVEDVQEEAPALILTEYDRETLLQFICNDHTYAKPYPILSSVNYKLKTQLSVLKLTTRDYPDKKKHRKLARSKMPVCNEDDIDVVTIEKPPPPLIKHDNNRARSVMNEVDNYLHSLWKDVDKDDEEKIVRGSWSRDQTSLFDSVSKILNNYQLAKLAYAENSDEPILRRLALDKATKRLRKQFGCTFWNPKLIGWLHGIMIDGLGSSLFLCYLEVLQSLKRKVPALFEKILLTDKQVAEKEITAGLPNLAARLRKSWEPSVGLNTKVTMQKFKTVPFLIVIPSGPSIPHQSMKRTRFWNNQLLNFGKTVPVNVPAYRTTEGYVIKYYIEHCISTVRANIVEFRTRFPDRHVVLMGWGVGSLIAFKVGLIEKVDAIICLGFPCKGLGYSGEDYWKHFTKIECPVLFFIGSHSRTNSVSKTEELRDKMKTQTNLILVENADEMLRLPKRHKRALAMTQNMIDKLLQDEIYLFLKDVLFKPKPVCKPPSSKSNQSPKKRKKKVDGNEADSKKKKRNNNIKIQHSNNQTSSGTTTGLLKTVDSIGQISTVVTAASTGLLMTGSISTTIPVTQLQNETLISPSVRVVGQKVISTDSNTNPKVTSKKSKEKSRSKSKKTSNQRTSSSASQQNFTANLGTFKSGNLTAQRFANTDLKPGSQLQQQLQQQQVTVQRVPTGSFVLSGASGHVRLQGGTNLLYLQQASSGASQIIHTPLVANSSGTFTAVLSTTMSGTTPSNFTFVPTQASMSQDETYQQTKTTDSSLMNVHLQVPKSKQVISPSGNIEVVPNPVATISKVASAPNSPSPVTTSTIMTHLSANDLRYLASLIAKHNSSQPTSPIQSSATGGVVGNVKFNPSVPEGLNLTLPTTSPIITSPDYKPTNISNWPQMTSVSAKTTTASPGVGKKATLLQGNQSLRKITYPPSLIQKVAAVHQQQRDASVKLKAHTLKPPRIITNTATVSRHNVSTTAISTKIMASLSSSNKSGQKIPVTLTIPVSRLQSSSVSSPGMNKSISVPGLSAYLSQQKFVLTSSKAGSNRTVILSPGLSKKDSSFSPKLMSAVPNEQHNTTTAARTVLVSTQSRALSKPGSSSVALNTVDTSALRKAASDIKLVGILNEHTRKITSTNLQPVMIPATPSSPTDEELSPITPRKHDEIERFEKEGMSALKVFSTPRSAIDSLKPNSTMTKLMSKHSNDSEVDFAVSPSVSARPSYPLNKPVESSKYVDVAKLLNASLGQLSRISNNNALSDKVTSPSCMQEGEGTLSANTRAFSKNMFEVSKSQTTQQNDEKTKPTMANFRSAAITTTTMDAKLRFEPLKVTANRSKLSSVLSSMRETGKIVVDQNGKMRATIVAKPSMISSKAAALIAKTTLISSSSATMFDSSKPVTVLSVSRSSTTQMSNPVVASLIASPNNNARFSLATPNINNLKVGSSLPVSNVTSSTALLRNISSIKTTDFVRIPSQGKTNAMTSIKSPTKNEKTNCTPLSKEQKEVLQHQSLSLSGKDLDAAKTESTPYVTRSGRVLKNKYPHSEDEKKSSPRKRRRTLSSEKDDGQPFIKQVNNLAGNQDVISTMSATGNLDCLLEAANLIKGGEHHDSVQIQNGNTATIHSNNIGEKSAEIFHLDNTATLAATAMLELLTGESVETNVNKDSVASTSNDSIHTNKLTNSTSVESVNNVTSVNKSNLDNEIVITDTTPLVNKLLCTDNNVVISNNSSDPMVCHENNVDGVKVNNITVNDKSTTSSLDENVEE